MLTMVHNNRVHIENGTLKVDRKFHVGMQSYVRGVRAPILSIHPKDSPGAVIMDPVEIPCTELGYSVMALRTDRLMRPLPGEREQLRDAIRTSQLVYGGDLGSAKLAAELGVPYILTREYDLLTQISVATSQVASGIRRAARTLRCVFNYARDIQFMRRAAQLHCNGYPIFDETRWFNDKRLLYLDSRMSGDAVISEPALLARLSAHTSRPLRLLYSGRYEPIKGAADAIRVALACLRRGMDIEMHCYGQGSLVDTMRTMVAEAKQTGRVVVHDTVPYPELIEIARTFDIFVCCHIQSDPSCTYLESLGCGLPIVGYGNRMWRRLSEESGAGLATPLHKPEAVADSVQKLSSNADVIRSMSLRARRFAMDHTFEHEFALRIDSLNAALSTT